LRDKEVRGKVVPEPVAATRFESSESASESADEGSSGSDSEDDDQPPLKRPAPPAAAAGKLAAAAVSKTSRAGRKPDSVQALASASAPLAEPKQSDSGKNALSLYLNQLPFDATKPKILRFFKEHGCDAVECRMVLGKGGLFKGVAFIEAKDRGAYNKGLALHRQLFGARRINVRPTKTPEELGQIVRKREQTLATRGLGFKTKTSPDQRPSKRGRLDGGSTGAPGKQGRRSTPGDITGDIQGRREQLNKQSTGQPKTGGRPRKSSQAQHQHQHHEEPKKQKQPPHQHNTTGTKNKSNSKKGKKRKHGD